jgi:hypothetical protein
MIWLYALILWTFVCVVWAHLRIDALSRRLEALATIVRNVDDRADRTERQCASNDAAYELLDTQVDNNTRAIDAQTKLSILHAQSATELRSELDKLKRTPYYGYRGEN